MNDVYVIVPIYNAQRTLYECLNSIKNQTYKNIKVILIDDGSTDESGRICEKFTQNDKRFIYIRTINNGLLKARIYGIKNVPNNKFVTFCDADDMLPKRAIEILVNLISESKADLACTHQDSILKNGIRVRKKTPLSLSKKRTFNKKEITRDILPSMFGRTDFPGYFHSKIFKRELLDCLLAVDLKDIFFQEDILLMLTILDKTNKLAVSPDITYLYRTGGATSKFMPNFFKDCIQLYNYKIDYLRANSSQKELWATTAIELKNEFFTWLCMSYNNYPKKDRAVRLEQEIEKCLQCPELLEASIYLENDISGLPGSNLALIERDKGRISNIVITETKRHRLLRNAKKVLMG